MNRSPGAATCPWTPRWAAAKLLVRLRFVTPAEVVRLSWVEWPFAGGVPERPKGAGCKPVGSAYGGSNPPSPISRSRPAAPPGRARAAPGSNPPSPTCCNENNDFTAQGHLLVSGRSTRKPFLFKPWPARQGSGRRSSPARQVPLIEQSAERHPANPHQGRSSSAVAREIRRESPGVVLLEQRDDDSPIGDG